MPSVPADGTSRSNLLLLLHCRIDPISCLPRYTATAVFPVKNCLRWARERRRQRECEPTSCSVEGVRTEGKRSRKYDWNTVTARALVPRTNLQDTSRTNQAFIKDFGGWNQHSPVRSGMFPTRPSPRTPISAVSEARSTFAANLSYTRERRAAAQRAVGWPLRAGS
jgi:hypothetical protein